MGKMTHPREHRRSRRQLLRQMAGVSMGLPLAHWGDLTALALAPRPVDRQHKRRDASAEPLFA